MTRRASLAAALALAAFGCHSAAPLDVLPESMAGGWRRTGKRAAPLSEAPDPVSYSVASRLEIAAYEGPGKLEARVYELVSPEAGASLAQRWRPSADTVFFTQGRFFVVVKWQQADRRALQEFVAALERQMQ